MKMSSDDLRELALNKGIPVNIDGKMFNADKTKVKKPKKDLLAPKVGADAKPKPVSAPSKPTATPVAAPIAVPVAPPVVNITVDMDKFSADNTAALKAITAAVGAQKPEKITEWKFEVKRSSQGLIETVIAKAT